MLRLHSMSHMDESIYFETEIFVVMRKIHRISNLIIAKSLKK